MIDKEKEMAQGSWFDLGMFIRNILFAMRAYAFETYPQASMAEFQDIVCEILSLEKNISIACGNVTGFPDTNHPLYPYPLNRETIEDFTRHYV